jgi:hypothetical protein
MAQRPHGGGFSVGASEPTLFDRGNHGRAEAANLMATVGQQPNEQIWSGHPVRALLQIRAGA